MADTSSLREIAKIDGEDVGSMRNRLLQHAIHEDTIFYNRLNFFAVIETVSLAAVASVDSAQHVLYGTIVFLGILVTVMWWFAQMLSDVFVDSLTARLLRELPEFKTGFDERQRSRTACARLVMTHGLPVIFLAVWIWLLTTREW